MKIYALNFVKNYDTKVYQKSAKNVLDNQIRLSKYNSLNFMASPLLYKYTSDFYGFNLLNQTNTLN